MQIFADNHFEKPVEILEAFDNESFKKAFLRLEDLRKCPEYHLLGYIRYEAKDVFFGKEIKSALPLLYFEAYKEGKRAGGQEGKRGCVNFVPCVDFEIYKKNIEQIKSEIAEGNTYQVNYTYDNKISTNMDGFELYNSILPNQKTPYNAYIKNKYEEILCFSPELFFELDGNKIRTKPMKGTVQRGETPEIDAKNIEFLKNDVKNCAENVMIVDLLRNDLGRIAKTGTVKVDKLFEVETHKTVHQMTSEISAQLEDNKTLYEIFEAIFPCGSVTGAPKISTMEIIERLEEGKRGVYCGAIGYINSESAVFCVPIRTLQKQIGQNEFSCRVGGAIVWDSTSEDEWAETLTKLKFLGVDNFKFIETILVENGELKYEEEHFERMEKSAKELGFVVDAKMLRGIEAKKKNCILRILLGKNGDFELQELPLEPVKTNRVIISKTFVDSKEPLLYHKTTFRPWYEDAMEKIKSGEVFDVIFFNERGELTEGARSNIVLQTDGKLYTSPVSCGLLNGVLRQKMLNEGKIQEKILYLDDLKNAQKIFCVNSVRGLVEVRVDFNR